MAIPFLVVLVAVATVARVHPDVNVRFKIDRDKALEGEVIGFSFEVTVRGGPFTVAFLSNDASGLEVICPPRAVVVSAAIPATLYGRLRCQRWGIYAFGGGRIQARDPVSGFVHEQRIEPACLLRIYPRPEKLRSLLGPKRLRPHTGSLTSSAAGAGLEYADIREWAPGDERRHVNWKASARRGLLYVNLFHPERSSTVVLVLDAFADVGTEDESSLDLAVRGATSVAIACLRRRDRVGLLTVGGEVRWLLPAMGIRQLYRIVNSLMETQLALNYFWPTVDAIPKHVIPAGALVVFLSPLVDRRMSGILADLHARGRDVAVVEISVDELLPDPATERERLARRLWSLNRESTRYEYREHGIPISEWKPGSDLQMTFGELQRFRRTSRRVHG